MVLGMSIAAAIVCLAAGVLQLREGSETTGWLLIVVGLLPLVGAILVRAAVRRP